MGNLPQFRFVTLCFIHETFFRSFICSWKGGYKVGAFSTMCLNVRHFACCAYRCTTDGTRNMSALGLSLCQSAVASKPGYSCTTHTRIQYRILSSPVSDGIDISTHPQSCSPGGVILMLKAIPIRHTPTGYDPLARSLPCTIPSCKAGTLSPELARNMLSCSRVRSATMVSGSSIGWSFSNWTEDVYRLHDITHPKCG